MPLKVTAAGLRTIAPGAADAIVLGIVSHQHLFGLYGIDTEQHLRHCLAQIACETVGFTRVEENLFYTTAKRVRAVWPSRFKSAAAATPYLRSPQKLANFVYGGRLGNVAPDDGWRYRGSGCMQTTGKANFADVERETNLPVVMQPDRLRAFPDALEAACIFWRDHDLNRYADADDVVGLTHAIQGGSGGLADRRIYADRARRVDWSIGAAPPAPKPSPSSPILRLGSKGETVAAMQELLAAHGYEILVDGIFGGGTDNLVREFQQDRGLMADGVVGPTTWAALRAAPPPAKTEPAPVAMEPLPDTGPRGLAGALVALFKLFSGRQA